MQREVTEEEWKKFKREVLDDPEKGAEWANRVIEAWIQRRSGRSRRRLKDSRKH